MKQNQELIAYAIFLVKRDGTPLQNMIVPYFTCTYKKESKPEKIHVISDEMGILSICKTGTYFFRDVPFHATPTMFI